MRPLLPALVLALCPLSAFAVPKVAAASKEGAVRRSCAVHELRNCAGASACEPDFRAPAPSSPLTRDDCIAKVKRLPCNAGKAKALRRFANWGGVEFPTCSVDARKGAPAAADKQADGQPRPKHDETGDGVAKPCHIRVERQCTGDGCVPAEESTSTSTFDMGVCYRLARRARCGALKPSEKARSRRVTAIWMGQSTGVCEVH